MQLVCLACGRSQRWGELDCPAVLADGSICGCDVYGSTVLGDVEVAPEEALPLRGVLGRVLTLPEGSAVVIYGGKGIGKSTVALDALDRPHVVSSEMRQAPVLRYAQRIGAPLASVSRWLRRADREELGIDPEEPPVLALDVADRSPVILDSINATGEPLAAWRALERHCAASGARGIGIMQVTKAGEARGTNEVLHEAEAVVRFENVDGEAVITVEKTRHGATGSVAYRLTAEGPRMAHRTAFYTVEGPPYRLAAYPSRGLRFDGFWRAAEASEELRQGLPAPPLATACLWSPLYPGGFHEPDDWRERARAAHLQGVPFLRPTTGELLEPPRDSGNQAGASDPIRDFHPSSGASNDGDPY